MTIKEAIEKHQKSNAHIFTEWGVYVKDGWGLKFDKDEYYKYFEHGSYLPDEKRWLLKNATLIYLREKTE